MGASIWIQVAMGLVSALVTEGYKLSEKIDFGSQAKKLIDAALDSLDVVRGVGMMFNTVTGGASEEEKAAARAFHADAKERQRLRLLELGFEV
jgi:hypothetical protein